MRLFRNPWLSSVCFLTINSADLKKFRFEISIRLKFFKTDSQSLVQANRHGRLAGAVEAVRSHGNNVHTDTAQRLFEFLLGI
jgi:hypothetical protein